MPKLVDRLPKLRFHAGSGQFLVVLSGESFYLGGDRAAATIQYNELVARWIAHGRRRLRGPAVEAMTVAALCERFLGHVRGYYRKGGEPTTEVGLIRLACDGLRTLYGSTPADAFGPAEFKQVRAYWVARDVTRKTANAYAARVKRCFRWGAEEGLVPASSWHALVAVPILRRNRTEARERPDVGPAPADAVEAVLPLLPPTAARMVRVQLLTGMRPGEVRRMRPCDVDRSGDVWVYTPAEHKTEHHGRGRAVAIGPRAQEALTPALEAAASPASWLFTGYGGGRRPITDAAYRKAVRQACDRAGVPRWTPNQLRHTLATLVRRRFGLDAAQVVLGHAEAKVTQVYAERDLERAAEVARQIG